MRLILGGSDIVNEHNVQKDCKYFDCWLILLLSCWITQDTRSKIIDTLLNIILGGMNITNKNIAHNSSQYFDYGLVLLQTPWIIQQAGPYTVETPLILIFRLWQ